MRNAIRAALAGLVAVAALAACGGDETASEPAAEPSPPPATQPSATETPTTEATTAEPTTGAETHEEMEENEPESAETTAPPAEAPAVVIEVQGGEPLGGAAEIEVNQGDKVDFLVESDLEGIVHVHGYDIEKKVTPTKSARVRFEATLEGIFEIELHLDGDEAQIAELTVRP
jgi:hypothetical protein